MILDSKADHEYAPITGLPDYCKHVAALAFGGDSSALAAKRVNSKYMYKHAIRFYMYV